MTCACPAWTLGYGPDDLVTYHLDAGVRMPVSGPVTGTVLALTPTTHTVMLALDAPLAALAGTPTLAVGGHGSADTFVSLVPGPVHCGACASHVYHGTRVPGCHACHRVPA